MASRRDELNAYTFAKKRTVASFLQPSPTGTEEGAPRPLRAVLPGAVIGTLIVAGFGAWGMFKPQAPTGWNEPGQKVIVASESTTRYVVLKTGKKTQLHPVLNLASARLLLDPDKYGVVKVAEKELDNGKIPHGPTIGIPYAPDRLPASEEAEKPKRWAACQQPAGNGTSTQQATFLLADRDADKVEGKNRLRGGDVMFVQNADDKALYLIDASGTKYLIGGEDWEAQDSEERELLLRSLVNGKPQKVTNEWLATFANGTPIVFPEMNGSIAEPANVPTLEQDANRVGMVLRAPTGSGPQHYVVQPNAVVPITDFTARLLLAHPDALSLRQNSKPKEVGTQAVSTPAPPSEGPTASYNWPELAPTQANSTTRNTVCSVLRNVNKSTGAPTLSTWSGPDYPTAIPDGSTSAYVTPGTGLLLRQFQGTDTKTGGTFLVTDTGLRYAVQTNTDSTTDATPDNEDRDSTQEANKAQIRLGYGDIDPVPVPANWAQFLPTGPRLDTASAQQPQGS